MKYLVDANVFCEPTTPYKVENVVRWLQANEADFVVDVIVMGEIWHGVDALPAGKRKQNLITWFEQVSRTVRCLEWTLETALVWGTLMNQVTKSGFTVGIKDTMIAASAKHHGLTVVTRNVDDFTRCGVPVLNPFT